MGGLIGLAVVLSVLAPVTVFVEARSGGPDPDKGPSYLILDSIRGSEWSEALALAHLATPPSLATLLEARDHQGFSAINLLACVGREDVLFSLLQGMGRLAGRDGHTVFRAALEDPSADAINHRARPIAELDGRGLYMHELLTLRDPPSRSPLLAGVAPLECAAANGHRAAAKLLVQAGAPPGRAFEIAKALGREAEFAAAVAAAHAEGCWVKPRVFPRPQPQPQRKGHHRGMGVAAEAVVPQGPGAFVLAPEDEFDRFDQIQDAAELTALALLTSMLLLPLWSALWALRRRAGRALRRVRAAALAWCGTAAEVLRGTRSAATLAGNPPAKEAPAADGTSAGGDGGAPLPCRSSKTRQPAASGGSSLSGSFAAAGSASAASGGGGQGRLKQGGAVGCNPARAAAKAAPAGTVSASAPEQPAPVEQPAVQLDGPRTVAPPSSGRRGPAGAPPEPAAASEAGRTIDDAHAQAPPPPPAARAASEEWVSEQGGYEAGGVLRALRSRAKPQAGGAAAAAACASAAHISGGGRRAPSHTSTADQSFGSEVVVVAPETSPGPFRAAAASAAPAGPATAPAVRPAAAPDRRSNGGTRAPPMATPPARAARDRASRAPAAAMAAGGDTAAAGAAPPPALPPAPGTPPAGRPPPAAMDGGAPWAALLKQPGQHARNQRDPPKHSAAAAAPQAAAAAAVTGTQACEPAARGAKAPTLPQGPPVAGGRSAGDTAPASDQQRAENCGATGVQPPPQAVGRATRQLPEVVVEAPPQERPALPKETPPPPQRTPPPPATAAACLASGVSAPDGGLPQLQAQEQKHASIGVGARSQPVLAAAPVSAALSGGVHAAASRVDGGGRGPHTAAPAAPATTADPFATAEQASSCGSGAGTPAATPTARLPCGLAGWASGSSSGSAADLLGPQLSADSNTTATAAALHASPSQQEARALLQLIAAGLAPTAAADVVSGAVAPEGACAAALLTQLQQRARAQAEREEEAWVLQQQRKQQAQQQQQQQRQQQQQQLHAARLAALQQAMQQQAQQGPSVPTSSPALATLAMQPPAGLLDLLARHRQQQLAAARARAHAAAHAQQWAPLVPLSPPASSWGPQRPSPVQPQLRPPQVLVPLPAAFPAALGPLPSPLEPVLLPPTPLGGALGGFSPHLLTPASPVSLESLSGTLSSPMHSAAALSHQASLDGACWPSGSGAAALSPVNSSAAATAAAATAAAAAVASIEVAVAAAEAAATGRRASAPGHYSAGYNTLLARPEGPPAAAGGASAAAGGGGGGGGGGGMQRGRSLSESLRMADELDELLGLANTALGWSPLPRAISAPSQRADVPPPGSPLPARPSAGPDPSAATPQRASPDSANTVGVLQGLHALQLPDGFI